MKNKIRLTESELVNFIKRLINEQYPKDIQSAVTFAQDVVKWLDKCSKSTPDARKWKLVNGFVNVEGDFYCFDQGLRDFKGVRFGVVTGYFRCNNNQLTSLEGAPQRVGGNFNCNENQLTSLKGAPQTVGGYFDCNENQLTSLEGAPQQVGGDFRCSNNQLTSLEGAPQQVGGDFYSYSNNKKFTEADIPNGTEVFGMFDQ